MSITAASASPLLTCSWKLGDPILAPPSSQSQVSIQPENLPHRNLYRLMAELIIPRPIAFVTTLSPEGISNLAPFSFFNGISSNPPTVMIAISHKGEGEKKDTLINIEKSGEFVINGVDPWLAGPMNFCSIDYPYGVDEMEKVGLTSLPSLRVKPLRVRESSMHMECQLEKTVLVGDGTEGSSTLVLGRIVHLHLSEDFYKEGKIIPGAYTPLARLGGTFYSFCKPNLDLPRPSN